jgi:hypothetical protein
MNPSFNVKGARTFQVVWNEITVLGPAWKDPNADAGSGGASAKQLAKPSAVVTSIPGNKRRAPGGPDFEPPAQRGPSLLAKLKAVVELPAVASSSKVPATIYATKRTGKKKVVVPPVSNVDATSDHAVHEMNDC